MPTKINKESLKRRLSKKALDAGLVIIGFGEVTSKPPVGIGLFSKKRKRKTRKNKPKKRKKRS